MVAVKYLHIISIQSSVRTDIKPPQIFRQIKVNDITYTVNKPTNFLKSNINGNISGCGWYIETSLGKQGKMRLITFDG